MAERVVLFRRPFEEAGITLKTLNNLYNKSEIKTNALKIVKRMMYQVHDDISSEAHSHLGQARQELILQTTTI